MLQSLVARGPGGVRLIVSEDHAGLKAARRAVFGGIPWQRCQFHLQQNAQTYVPHKELQAEVAEDIRVIFNAPIDPPLSSIWPERCKSTAKPLPAWPIGWRKTSRKALLFFPS